MLLCTIFLFFCYKYILLIYFTTLLLYRCVLLSSLLHVYKLYFFFFFYLLHFSVAHQNSSHHYLFSFFLQALHYFSLNIIYKFAFNTHTLLQPTVAHVHTHPKSKAHSPLHWGCQTQLKSYDLVTRFRPDLRCTAHTHTWSTSWSSPFCLGFTPIAPPSRPLLGNFSSFCNPATIRRTLCHFLRRRWWSSNLEPPPSPLFPLSSTSSCFARGNLDRKYFITQHTWSKPLHTLSENNTQDQ